MVSSEKCCLRDTRSLILQRHIVQQQVSTFIEFSIIHHMCEHVFKLTYNIHQYPYRSFEVPGTSVVSKGTKVTQYSLQTYPCALDTPGNYKVLVSLMHFNREQTVSNPARPSKMDLKGTSTTLKEHRRPRKEHWRPQKYLYKNVSKSWSIVSFQLANCFYVHARRRKDEL